MSAETTSSGSVSGKWTPSQPQESAPAEVEALEPLLSLIQFEWHDRTCPEGSECRDRILHAVSAVGVQSVLVDITKAVLASDWLASTLAEREAAAEVRGARDALLAAADEVHKEARWQTEQSMRWNDLPEQRLHEYARARLSIVGVILRDRAASLARQSPS